MDVGVLRERISATLDANADVRRQAELDLKYAEEQSGFLNALLDILQTEQVHTVRLSTAVYLKNRVNRGWAPPDDLPLQKSISEEEKLAVRNRLLPVLATAHSQVRAQIIPTLQKILQYDFPARWPNFMDITLQLLNTNDASSVYAGLQCVLAICRTYRFKSGENREDFNRIVEASFPQILAIGTRLLDERSLKAAELLRIVIKSYKHAIYFDLPTSLMGQDVLVNWCTLFIRTVSKEPPPEALPEDVDERETNHWWKAKKWAYANLNRLFIRYGNPSTVSKNHAQDYSEFAKLFIASFAPEILNAYLAEIDKWVSKTAWLSRPSLSYTLGFLDECVKPKTTWAHLKPHMENIIRHVVFPILCQTDEDLELFSDDPKEYVHKKLNYYEEVSAPDVAAISFLLSLTKCRKKQTFTILAFVNEIVTKYEMALDAERNAREKEGALRMISSLSEVLLAKKSPIAHQVESFFVRHVFPEFRSPHGFLRARACDCLQKFERLDFQEHSNLVLVYRNVLESLTDPQLPVQIEAALALQVLIRHDLIRSEMQSNIPQIMQQLLNLANEVDVDSLANVMEDFVEVFSTELTPFAVALSEQLRDTYLRIVRELVERQGTREDEDGFGDFMDDKSITALGVLQTVGTLILTLESTPDVLLHLETILMPVITITLENKLYDLYNEIFEIVESCTFSAKAISPSMWQAFEQVHKTFKNGAELYLEDMLPALENFITFGAATMVQQRQYIDAVVGMVNDIFHDEKVGGNDRICGCKLAECILLNLRGNVDQYIPTFVELAMHALLAPDHKVKSYRIHLIEMVVNAIYYDPRLALRVLEAKGWTNKFFSSWFSNISYFSRVHDKKLSILAICTLLTLGAKEIPTSVQTGWPRLVGGILQLFTTLPEAEKNRDEMNRDNDFTLNDEEEDEDEVEAWDGEGEGVTETETEDNDGDVKDESTAYLEFLNDQAQKFNAANAEDDDELDEESIMDSPLEKIEPYGIFKVTILQLQTGEPELYESLTKHLLQHDKSALEAIVAHADMIQRDAVAALAMTQNGSAAQ